MQECLISIVRIGVACSVESPRKRIEIGDVIRELQLIKDILRASGMNYSSISGRRECENEIIKGRLRFVNRDGVEESLTSTITIGIFGNAKRRNGNYQFCQVVGLDQGHPSSITGDDE
ncbi:hypothetical protein LguiB_035380 [Lonicera macranthoides]